MSNSNRQRILDYLADSLFAAITVADGYNLDVKKYERGLKSTAELTGNDIPALFVASADEDFEDTKMGTPHGFISNMTIFIYGVVAQETSTLDIQQQLDYLIEDTRKALYLDTTLGSRCNSMRIDAVETDEGDQHPYAYFKMTVIVRYTGNKTSP